jgi:hypothetical protein
VKENPMKILQTIAASAISLAAAGFALPASAAVIYDTSPSTGAIANQGYSDVLGNDFTVNSSSVTVTALGAFDSPLSTITTDITVGLFNLTTSSYVTPLVDFDGTNDPTGAAYVFKAIAPVTLVSGDSYSIIGIGFNNVDEDYNTNTTGQDGNSLITFNSLGGELTNGFSRFGGGGNPALATPFGFPSTFGAGTFAVADVPEPITLSLFGAGLVGAAGLRRRKKKAS